MTNRLFPRANFNATQTLVPEINRYARPLNFGTKRFSDFDFEMSQGLSDLEFNHLRSKTSDRRRNTFEGELDIDARWI